MQTSDQNKSILFLGIFSIVALILQAVLLSHIYSVSNQVQSDEEYAMVPAQSPGTNSAWNNLVKARAADRDARAALAACQAAGGNCDAQIAALQAADKALSDAQDAYNNAKNPPATQPSAPTSQPDYSNS